MPKGHAAPLASISGCRGAVPRGQGCSQNRQGEEGSLQGAKICLGQRSSTDNGPQDQVL